VDPAPTAPKRPRCGVVDVGGARYGTVMEPSRAAPGDQVVLSGPTLRGEDGRYFPADRLEVWFNTKVPVSQVPDASPIYTRTDPAAGHGQRHGELHFQHAFHRPWGSAGPLQGERARVPRGRLWVLVAPLLHRDVALSSHAIVAWTSVA
jgi:hypothetical protein